MDKPVNTLALTKWVPYIPPEVRSRMRELAPMLSVLGYDPDAYPPAYGTPDQAVLNQSLQLMMHADKHETRVHGERLNVQERVVQRSLGPL